MYSGITVWRGVKDHSLPSAVRRLCSAGRQANLLMSAVFGSTLAAPGRRTSVDVRSSNGFFWPTAHGVLLRVHGGVSFTTLLSLLFLSVRSYASHFGHASRGLSM